MARKAKPATGKSVEALRHARADATRKNIPTAEYQSVTEKEAQDPVRVAYERRNRDLDPQLVWRGNAHRRRQDRALPATPSIREISNWRDGFGGAQNQVYVVQTNERVIERCLLMATDPGDLVLDPTCGSGTTARPCT